MSRRGHVAIFVGSAIAALLLAGPAGLRAAGPLLVSKSGEPYRWDVSRPIPLNLDRGRLGSYSNSDALQKLVLPALARWTAVPTARVSWATAVMPRDIQSADDLIWALDSGYNPVVFDQEGMIFAALGLSTQEVLAAATPYKAHGTTIVQGFVIINGLLIGALISSGGMSQDDIVGTIAHEIGHFLNLDHSQVNGHMFFGDTDDPSYRKFGAPPADSVELMYPIYKKGMGTRNLTQDDQAALSMLYPAESFSAAGSISGRILRWDRSSQIQGANVVARNAANPFYDAVSCVSGYRYAGDNGGSSDPSLQGLFEIGGLTPGASYLVEMVGLLPVKDAGSSTGPRFPAIALPADEEFYNGANESESNPPDNPSDSTPIQAQAGRTVNGVDIICNRSLPKTAPVGLGFGSRDSNLATAGKIDAFSFRSQPFSYVRISVEPEVGYIKQLVPVLELYSPSGTYLDSAVMDTGLGMDRYVALEYLITATGPYTLLVSDKNYSATGSYKITLTLLKAFSPPQIPIAFGKATTATISAAYQYDLYKIQGDSGDVLVGNIGWESNNVWAAPEIYTADGFRFANSLYRTVLPQGGEFYLVVNSVKYEQETGAVPYTLTVQRVNNPGNVSPLSFGQTRSASSSAAGELSTHTFTAGADERLLIRYGESAGGWGCIGVELYDPDGYPVEFYGSTISASKTGQYAILVSAQEKNCAYALTVQRTKNPGNAVPVELGKSYTGLSAHEGAIATYVLSAEAGDTVVLQVTRAPGDRWLNAALYDPDGILVRQDWTYTESSRIRLQAPIEKAGRYALFCYADGLIGGYGISIDRLNEPVNATPLAFGDSVTGSTASAAGMPLYSWTANAGDVIAVTGTIKGGASSSPLHMEVYDPDGLLTKGSVSAKTGRYALLVGASWETTTTEFGVGIQRLNNPDKVLPLVIGQPVKASITKVGQIATYQWTGTVNDLLTLKFVADAANPALPNFAFYDPEGNYVTGMTPKQSESAVTIVLKKNGSHLLLVSDAEGRGSGSFQFTLVCESCQLSFPQPASVLYFPEVNSSASEFQGFAICNMSAQPSSLHFTAYDSAGSIIATADRNLASNTQLAWLAQELFGPAITGKQAWVEVTSEAPNQKGIFLSFDPEVSRMDGAEAFSSNSSVWFLSDILAGPGESVELNLFNPSNTRVGASLMLNDRAGKQIESFSVAIQPKGTWTGRLDEIFKKENVTADGYVSCIYYGCERIMAIEHLRGKDSLAMIRGSGTPSVSALFAPHFAAGGGYYTKLSLINSFCCSSTTATITVYDDQGLPDVEAGSSPITITLPGWGKALVDIGELLGYGNDDTVHTGWLKIEWDYSALRGSISIGDNVNGSLTSMALSEVGTRDAVIPHVAQNDFYFTGLALLNFTHKPAQVTVKVFNSAGVLTGSSTFQIRGGAKLTKLINEIVPGLKSQVGGFIRVTSDRDLLIYSLFGTNSLSALSVIPAQSVKP